MKKVAKAEVKFGWHGRDHWILLLECGHTTKRQCKMKNRNEQLPAPKSAKCYECEKEEKKP